MRYRLGTMGYSYDDWAGTFYPGKTPRGRWLETYARTFPGVELNTTFHATPSPDRIRAWGAAVPPEFRFAIKTGRQITHDLPLSAAGGPMLEFLEVMRTFGPLAGPVLIQFPPTLAADASASLDAFLGTLPTDFRYAVEFRHSSWLKDRTADLLRRHRVCWVALDHVDHPALADVPATTDFLYVRLVGRHGRYDNPGRELLDPTPQLRRWHEWIARTADGGGIDETWVLFNNDYAGHAPATLRRFADLAAVRLPRREVEVDLFGSVIR